MNSFMLKVGFERFRLPPGKLALVSEQIEAGGIVNAPQPRAVPPLAKRLGRWLTPNHAAGTLITRTRSRTGENRFSIRSTSRTHSVGTAKPPSALEPTDIALNAGWAASKLESRSLVP